ncbi:hypothetical protein [Actinomadura sp. KC06]|uniref:hypothetical protein n=1 Tax=Actinomadura sp. KC06 TaxID=2530369 RepID=UPI0014045845|nr:hypothetical protein [Actinomadura sp. KC06]
MSSGEYQEFEMSLDVKVPNAKIFGSFTVARGVGGGVHAAGRAGRGGGRRGSG